MKKPNRVPSDTSENFQLYMDESRRITLPIRVRRELAKERKGYVVLYAGMNRTIIVSLPSEVAREIRRIRSGEKSDWRDPRHEARLHVGAGIKCVPDAEGRIKIPIDAFCFT